MKRVWGFLVVWGFTQVSWAWSAHHLITRAALEKQTELKKVSVIATAAADMASKLGFDSVRALNESIQIRKEYPFDFRAGEVAGQPISLVEVLSVYSDEPDWGMDKELFGKDQYPELWDDNYTFMGGDKGTPSQAFRHMYWEPLDWHNPIETLNFPFLLKPAGKAPERADVFFGLSQRSCAIGEKYWCARFLANALHYVEDVSQPFHATQLASKDFIKQAVTHKPYGWPISGLDSWLNLFDPKAILSVFNDFVKKTTQVNAYYHFAFEGYVGHVMTVAPNTIYGKRLKSALAAAVNSATAACNPKDETLRLAHLSVANSSEAGDLSIQFFPALPEDVLNFNAEKTVEDFLAAVNVDQYKAQTEEKMKLETLVLGQFRELGSSIRCLADTIPK